MQETLRLPVTSSDFVDIKHGFRACDYEQLRGMLEGMRNTLDIVSDDEVTMLQIMSGGQVFLIKKALSILRMSSNKDTFDGHNLQSIGFPATDDAQKNLLLSLTQNSMVELVIFIGYQLASEGYIFSKFPPSIMEPLQNDTCKNFRKMVEVMDLTDKLNFVKVFDRDVLMFYEKLIIAHSLTKSGQDSLKNFLKCNNFCDDSDPIFYLLPDDVKVSNYVALRQEVHQIKLFLMYSETEQTNDVSEHLSTTEGDSPQTSKFASGRGQCWLWTVDQGIRMDLAQEQSWYEGEANARNLWFETSNSSTSGDKSSFSEKNTLSDSDLLESNIVYDSDTSQDIPICREKAAIAIQTWWRRNQPQTRTSPIDLNGGSQVSESMSLINTSIVISDSKNWGQFCSTRTSLFAVILIAVLWSSILYTQKFFSHSNYLSIVSSGSSSSEARDWLQARRLTDDSIHSLVALGVRDVQDIVTLAELEPNFMNKLSQLDALKLNKALLQYKEQENIIPIAKTSKNHFLLEDDLVLLNECVEEEMKYTAEIERAVEIHHTERTEHTKGMPNGINIEPHNLFTEWSGIIWLCASIILFLLLLIFKKAYKVLFPQSSITMLQGNSRKSDCYSQPIDSSIEFSNREQTTKFRNDVMVGHATKALGPKMFNKCANNYSFLKIKASRKTSFGPKLSSLVEPDKVKEEEAARVIQKSWGTFYRIRTNGITPSLNVAAIKKIPCLKSNSLPTINDEWSVVSHDPY